MRTFVITMDGIARIMRTYALGPGGRVLIDEVDEAPDALAVIAKWHPRHKDQVTSTREIAESDIPPFLFKDAWEDDGTNIVHDMNKCRVIKTDQIRAERDIRLAATDVEVLKLDGQAVPVPLKAKRQTLRDIPATVQSDLDAITTPEALEAFKPTWP